MRVSPKVFVRLFAPALVAAAACTHSTLTLASKGAAVEHVSATAHLDGATITWDAPADAPAANVYLSTDPAVTAASATRSFPGATSPLTVSALTETPWYAVVAAVGTAGERALSPAVRIDPIPSGNAGLTPLPAPAWSKDFTPAARFGGTLVAAGDTNHDGFGDVLIGAWEWSNGENREGGVFLYRGTATGLEDNYSWHDECDQLTAACGTGAAAGDYDGDGEIDVVSGGANYDGTLTNEGAAALFPGTSAGPLLSITHAFLSGQTNAYMGRHLGGVGDVNHDGKEDLLIPALNYDDPLVDEGTVFLYLGTAGNLTQNPVWHASGGITNAGFGWNVSTTPGDVNGDTFMDIVVGGFRTTNPESEEGRVSFFPGAAAGPPAAPTWTWEPDEANARFGNAVALGDVNGDGFADLIAGAPGHGGGIGRAYAFFGSATGLAASPSWMVDGTIADSALGESVASAGDINGDGFDDVLVGEPGFDGAAGTDSGRALLFLGGPAGPAAIPSWIREGTDAQERLGGTVGGARDVNGDGTDDVLLGIESESQLTNAIGRAELFFGSPASGPAVDAGTPLDIAMAAPSSLAATYAISGPLADVHDCTIDWGDATTPTTLAPCSSAMLTAAKHTWTNAGVFTARVRVTNEYGAAGESVTTVHVH